MRGKYNIHSMYIYICTSSSVSIVIFLKDTGKDDTTIYSTFLNPQTFRIMLTSISCLYYFKQQNLMYKSDTLFPISSDKFILSVSIIADVEHCPTTPPPESIDWPEDPTATAPTKTMVVTEENVRRSGNAVKLQRWHHHEPQPLVDFRTLVPTDVQIFWAQSSLPSWKRHGCQLPLITEQM